MLFFFSERIKLLNCLEIQRNSQITSESPQTTTLLSKSIKQLWKNSLRASNLSHILKYVPNMKMQCTPHQDFDKRKIVQLHCLFFHGNCFSLIYSSCQYLLTIFYCCWDHSIPTCQFSQVFLLDTPCNFRHCSWFKHYYVLNIVQLI